MPGTTATTNISSATISTTATGRTRRRKSKSFRRSRTPSPRLLRLSDHLLWQLSLLPDDEQVRDIGSAIIGNLNDDGMLVASLEEIAAMGPWPVEAVERTLKVVQGFDPIGVAARDLQECLLLQLRHIGLEGTPTEKIVTEHLRLLQNHQVPEIAKRLGMSIEDLKEHVEIIRHLDPKPAAATTLRSRITSSRTSTSSRSRTSTWPC